MIPLIRLTRSAYHLCSVLTKTRSERFQTIFIITLHPLSCYLRPRLYRYPSLLGTSVHVYCISSLKLLDNNNILLYNGSSRLPAQLLIGFIRSRNNGTEVKHRFRLFTTTPIHDHELPSSILHDIHNTSVTVIVWPSIHCLP